MPLFREKMVLITEKNNPLPNNMKAENLDAVKEVRLPWYPEYELWHEIYFRPFCSDSSCHYLHYLSYCSVE